MTDFFKKLPQIFYSRAFYADLVRRGHGIGMAFLTFQVLLMLTVPVLTAIPYWPQTHKGVDDFFAAMPSVTLTDEKLSIDHVSPYEVPFTVNGKKITSVLFDMSVNSRDVEAVKKTLHDNNALALVTPDFIAVSKKESIEFDDYAAYKNQTRVFTHAEWQDFGREALSLGAPLLVVFAFIGMLVTRLILTLGGGIAIRFAMLFRKQQNDMASAMRLSAAASTPATVLNFVVALAGLAAGNVAAFMLPSFVGFALWLGFVGFGLWALAQEDGQNPAPAP